MANARRTLASTQMLVSQREVGTEKWDQGP